jgi:hypothetical protein
MDGHRSSQKVLLKILKSSRKNNNVERAMEYLIINQENMMDVVVPPLVSDEIIQYDPNYKIQTNNSVSEEDLQKAINESLKDSKPLNTSSDSDLNRAIEESLKEQSTPSTLIFPSFNEATEKRQKDT